MKKEKILLDTIMHKHNSGELTWSPSFVSSMFTCRLYDLEIQIHLYATHCSLSFKKNGILSDVRLYSKEYPEIMQIYNALPIKKQDDIDDIIDSIGDKQTMRHIKIESILEQTYSQNTAKKSQIGRLKDWLSKFVFHNKQRTKK